MIVRIFLLLFATAFPLLAQSSAPTSPPGYETVQLVHARSSGHYIVDVQIDEKPLRFVVDSGAGMAIVLSKPTAKALRKRTKSAGEAGGITGSVKIRKTEVKSLKVVGVSRVFEDFDGYVVDLGKVQIYQGNEPITPDGLLGVSVLDQWSAVIDTGMGRLLIPTAQTPDTSFTQWMRSRGANIVPLHKGSSGFALLDLTVKNKTYTFLVDTGAGQNTIEPVVARRLGLSDLGEGGEVAGIGKKVITGLNVAEAEDVVLGGVIKLRKLRFRVNGRATEINVPAGKTYGGIIGSQTLAAMNAYLDFGTYSLIIPKLRETQLRTVDTRALTPEMLKRLVAEPRKDESPAKPEPADKPESTPQPPPVRRGF